MQDNEQYTVTVTGNDMSFERQVAREIGEKIVILAVTGSLVSDGKIGHSPANGGRRLENQQPTNGEQQGPAEARPEKSISEFFNEIGPKRNPDRIAAIGRYLMLYHGKERFTRDDLTEWFKNARVRVPKNLTRDVNWTIRAGWIAEDHSPNSKNTKSLYYITQPGIDVVDAKFPREEIEKTSSSTRKSRRPGPTSQSRSG